MGARRHFPEIEMARLRLLTGYEKPPGSAATIGDCLENRTTTLQIRCTRYKPERCRHWDRIDLLELARSQGLYRTIRSLRFRCKLCGAPGKVDIYLDG